MNLNNKILIVSANFLVVLLIGYWFDWEPQYQALESAHQEGLKLQQQLVAKKSFLSVVQQLPRRSQLPELLEEIVKIGKANDIEIKLLKLLSEKSADILFALPVQIKAMGNYAEFIKFINQLVNRKGLIVIQDFSIQQQELDLMAMVYCYAGEQHHYIAKQSGVVATAAAKIAGTIRQGDNAWEIIATNNDSVYRIQRMQ